MMKALDHPELKPPPHFDWSVSMEVWGQGHRPGTRSSLNDLRPKGLVVHPDVGTLVGEEKVT